jgi:uncharacterized protein
MLDEKFCCYRSYKAKPWRALDNDGVFRGCDEIYFCHCVIPLFVILRLSPLIKVALDMFMIATEFLIEHLQMKKIGSIFIKDLPAMVAIHNENLVRPIGIFYHEESNLMLIHIIANTTGLEWQVADAIVELAERTEASKIITLEGVSNNAPDGNDDTSIMFYANREERIKAMREKQFDPLKEGIVMGVTSTLMLKADSYDLLALFALTHSQLPDSKAAAEVVKVLDKMLTLNVDYEPLLQTAELFEGKLKSMMSQSKRSMDERDKKIMSYVG